MSIAQNRDIAIAFSKYQRARNAAGIWLDYRRSLFHKRVIINHFPPALMIEPTNICNLHCPLCPSGNNSLKRPRGMLSIQSFRTIVDEVYRKVGMLIMWNQGEPFLNPDCISMLRYASSKELYTMISTNASLNLDAKAIVQSGLNKIIISMDGITETTYNQYRVNGNYNLVLENMKALVKARRDLHYGNPQLIWQFIVMKQNEHEIAQVKQMAKEVGVDKLEFKSVQIYTEDDLVFLPSDHRMSRYIAEGKHFELKTRLLNRCRRLWTQPVINWDGELCICCYDKDLQFNIGIVSEHSFKSLWQGSAMNEIRGQILQDRSKYEICRNCGEGIVQKLQV
ncbi:MAG: radical SAM/SPASM domain-containing protein [Candidatus Cloacimonadaceae bacterium]